VTYPNDHVHLFRSVLFIPLVCSRTSCHTYETSLVDVAARHKANVLLELSLDLGLRKIGIAFSMLCFWITY
jgi:hypothetical protein